MTIEIVKRVASSILLIPAVIFIIYNGSVLFNLFLILCFIISIKELFNLTKIIPIRLFGIFFLLISLYSFYCLKYNFENLNYIYLVLLVCISTDIGGYLFGKFFKGPKLTAISPNKTYSGVLGSYIISIISSFIFLDSQIVENTISLSGETLILILLVSTVSQIGDLIISYLKRMSNIKDTGNIIPGHGGLLDRIDGMIFAFPIFYLISLEGYKII